MASLSECLHSRREQLQHAHEQQIAFMHYPQVLPQHVRAGTVQLPVPATCKFKKQFCLTAQDYSTCRVATEEA